MFKYLSSAAVFLAANAADLPEVCEPPTSVEHEKMAPQGITLGETSTIIWPVFKVSPESCVLGYQVKVSKELTDYVKVNTADRTLSILVAVDAKIVSK